jgi:glycosyltransferase involved in cell wall biosynthesis
MTTGVGISTPLVSIALPVHNGERFLAEALQSLLGQTFKDFELIIGDNGSTDGTVEICQDAVAADPRVRYLRSPTNHGAAWNYNRLFGQARGKYFKWAAHDDVYDRLWLERCVDALDADPGVVLAYTRTIEIDATGAELENYRPLRYARSGRPSRRAHEVLSKRSRCFEAFGLARREALEGTGLIGAYTSSDRTLILELALRGQFCEVPEYLFLHRQHQGRSVRVFPDARQRLAWFEPVTTSRRIFPTWRLLREYGRAIGRAPIPTPERLRSAACLLPWMVHNRTALRHDLDRLNRSPVAPFAEGGDAQRGRPG